MTRTADTAALPPGAPAANRARRLPAVAACVLMTAAIAGLYALNVRGYYFVADDAFISFRYARNLVAGHGLVWNPGELVEGYTNLSWVLMTASAMRLGLEPESASTSVSIASGVLLLILLARFAARRSGWVQPVTWLPLLVLATSRSFTAWSSGGLETMFFTLLVFAAFTTHIGERERRTRRPIASALMFAAAALTRPEGILFAFVCGVFFLAEVGLRKRAPGELAAWTAPLVLVVGAHFLWRYSYYGFWLPNTFHAKVNGLWLEQSLKYFAIFHDDYKVLWFVPLMLLPLAIRRGYEHALFGAAIGLYFAYILFIGGDRFEFRFLVVVFPYAYWMMAEGVRRIAQCPARAAWQKIAWPAVATAIAAMLVVTTHLGSVRPEARRSRHHIESIQGIRNYTASRIAEGKALRDLIARGVLPADVLFCTGGAGAVPYYSEWPTIDYRGLNDVGIARSEILPNGEIAHQHAASREYLSQRRVVVFDSLNGLFHSDPERYRGGVRRATGSWDLRAIRLGRFALVFTTMVDDAEFRRLFGHLEILY